ncbi:MAG: elongation factor P [Chloroflexi bacterium]|nr:elongation factor P [Chloroflexota bacterium]
MPETISYSDLRRGQIIELDGEPYQVQDWKHVVMQQRTPILTLKLRHLKTGKAFERNVPGNQRLALADVETRKIQYLYNDGQHYYFMDMESYEQYPLTSQEVAGSALYLKEGMTLNLLFYNGQPVSVEPPTFVDLKVTDTPPAFKGDTAQAGRKSATLETGVSVKVPLHVNIGDVVKVDTRNGDYIETVKP